jgi:hypothetical protein
MRHEIFNEFGYEEVFADVFDWILKVEGRPANA